MLLSNNSSGHLVGLWLAVAAVTECNFLSINKKRGQEECWRDCVDGKESGLQKMWVNHY